jgi:hypothetical protein
MQVFGEHINQNTHMDIKIVKMIFYFHNYLKNLENNIQMCICFKSLNGQLFM